MKFLFCVFFFLRGSLLIFKIIYVLFEKKSQADFCSCPVFSKLPLFWSYFFCRYQGTFYSISAFCKSSFFKNILSGLFNIYISDLSYKKLLWVTLHIYIIIFPLLLNLLVSFCLSDYYFSIDAKLSFIYSDIQIYVNYLFRILPIADFYKNFLVAKFPIFRKMAFFEIYSSHKMLSFSTFFFRK